MDGWVVQVEGARRGEVWTRADLGTGSYEAVAWFGAGIADAEAQSVLTAVRERSTPAGLRFAVRVPLDPATRPLTPTEDVLAAAGLRRVATFAGNPEGPRAWAGEQRWEADGPVSPRR